MLKLSETAFSKIFLRNGVDKDSDTNYLKLQSCILLLKLLKLSNRFQM